MAVGRGFPYSFINAFIGVLLLTYAIQHGLYDHKEYDQVQKLDIWNLSVGGFEFGRDSE